MDSRKNNLILITLLTLYCPLLASSQTILDYYAFLKLVKKYNPLVQSAELNPAYHKAYAQKYRSIFDPTITSSITSKFYNQKSYYAIQSLEIKIPTWTGITIKGNWELNQGLFLNPERNVPPEGLYGIGIEIPLIQGLIVNQNRLYFRIAQIHNSLGKITQYYLLNNLFQEANQIYWNWFQTFHILQTYQNILNTLEQQLEWTRTSAEAGAKPFIDTLKIYSQYTYYQLALQKAQVDFAIASADLYTFIWNQHTRSDSLIPLSDSIPNLPPLPLPPQIDSLLNKHPYLLTLQQKMKITQLELQWNREQIKPKLNFHYSLLASNPFTTLSSLSPNNYKWGLSFYFPTLMRKARAQTKISSIQLQMQQYDYWFKKTQIRNTCLYYFQILEQLRVALQNAKANVETYQQLLLAMQEAYQAGAENLINLNFIQLQYVESKIKWIEILTKYCIAYGKLYSYLGLGYQYLLEEE